MPTTSRYFSRPLRPFPQHGEGLERVKGIEPSSSAWKAVALPLSYTRVCPTWPFPSTPLKTNPSTPFQRTATDPGSARPPHHRGGGTGWWRGLDSNQRRLSQRIYSPSPLATRAPLRCAIPQCHPNDNKRRPPAGWLSPSLVKTLLWYRYIRHAEAPLCRRPNHPADTQRHIARP